MATAYSPSAVPGPAMPAPADILSHYDRRVLEEFVASAIDLLDTLDGDPDLEDDDPQGQCDEEGINTLPSGWQASGPIRYAYGCPISEGGI